MISIQLIDNGPAGCQFTFGDIDSQSAFVIAAGSRPLPVDETEIAGVVMRLLLAGHDVRLILPSTELPPDPDRCPLCQDPFCDNPGKYTVDRGPRPAPAGRRR